MKQYLLFSIFYFLCSCNNSSKEKIVHKAQEKEIIVYENIYINDSIAKKIFLKGLNLLENNNYNEAYTYFREANKRQPNNVIILNALANIENIKGEKSEAEAKYKKSISIDSSYVISYVNYGKLLNQKKLYDEANSILIKGLKLNPSKAERTALYYNLIFTMVNTGKCEKAKHYAILAKENSEFEDQKNEIADIIKGIELYCENL
ncbi:hypothetical protein [Chryseobacterium limigenitum]|uniref:Tetratricopeptide repeat-containing protein n=1 Tax=Chryseobacterium limigenitum TaxID=1612149 RepID=A0A1K2IVJ8_9FLAO|nr:hypothetical protein [Chryseobacterium limigenitum]SFZ96290.1 Tetratricopeptide repeat-containing protein [Chryseobacterium limigenitum]